MSLKLMKRLLMKMAYGVYSKETKRFLLAFIDYQYAFNNYQITKNQIILAVISENMSRQLIISY
jgi:hypothetical protein